ESKAIAHRLRTIFEHDWAFATTGRWKNSSVSPFSISPSDVELVASPERLNPKRIPTALTRLLSLISNAKKSLRISLLDYSTTSDSEGRKPWLELDDTLRAAAARGVKVQLLVSHWNTTKGEIGSIKALSGI